MPTTIIKKYRFTGNIEMQSIAKALASKGIKIIHHDEGYLKLAYEKNKYVLLLLKRKYPLLRLSLVLPWWWYIISIIVPVLIFLPIIFGVESIPSISENVEIAIKSAFVVFLIIWIFYVAWVVPNKTAKKFVKFFESNILRL